MRPRDIDRFFTILSQHFPFPLTVVLTGGGAAILEGVTRGTRDLDFQITLRGSAARRREPFERAIEETERLTGIAAQYDTSIESWSSIAWPSPKPKTRRYRRFGSIEVRILDPLYWSVGKMGRYLSSDVSDIVTVFKQMKVTPESAARAWGRALGRSPMSNMQSVFRRQVLHFFDYHGLAIWGKSVSPSRLKNLFLKTAQFTRQA